MKTWIASWKPYFSLYRLKAMQEMQYRAAYVCYRRCMHGLILQQIWIPMEIHKALRLLWQIVMKVPTPRRCR